MKSSTRLDSVVFQLTPTRTRCDLVITADGKTKKIASGLLNPFLAHLKAAQEQIRKGGYSIVLVPDHGTDASWFTKGTVERFVRFVSTPEILERVYTIESEIVQIEEAISFQNSTATGPPTQVEEYQMKSQETSEGGKTVLGSCEEKAIVLYKGDVHPRETESSTNEGNSRVQLLKILETRKRALQKEQGMAFARAAAAGFDVDDIAPLMSFADCFGASRMKEACSRFIQLWKVKHESGQWLEVEAPEALSPINTPGIKLSDSSEKPRELQLEYPPVSENNGLTYKMGNPDMKPQMDQQVPPYPREFPPGHLPHPMYPPWPIHPQAGPLPFQQYPMPIPYYQNYPGNGAFFQPPYPSLDESTSHVGPRTGHGSNPIDSRDLSSGSESRGSEASKRKKSDKSSRKKSGVVVIRNINYITPRQHSSDGESQSDSDTEEDGNLKKGSSHSNRQVHDVRSEDAFMTLRNEEGTSGRSRDDGQWQAFQSFLLRDADEDDNPSKGVRRKKQTGAGADPLIPGGREVGGVQNGRYSGFHDIAGATSSMPKSVHADMLISGRADDFVYNADPIDDRMDMGLDGMRKQRGAYMRTSSQGDDLMINGRKLMDLPNNSVDPLIGNGADVSSNRNNSRSRAMADDSFMVSSRANISDQGRGDDRTVIDMDSEVPSVLSGAGKHTDGASFHYDYEPNVLSLMPDRATDSERVGYDLSMEHELHARSGGTKKTNDKEEVSKDSKVGSRKVLKGPRSGVENKTTGNVKGAGKPSKLSPSADARARADKLRNFKADLQKLKKEKEEEQIKRIEALKIERQKRIAAKSKTNPGKSSLPTQPTRKQQSAKPSPSSDKGSKFSDTKPGPSSPLQRSTIRSISKGPANSRESPTPGRLSNSLVRSKVTRSASSLFENKDESVEVTPDSKATMARIKRLSEPKSIKHPTSSVSRSAEQVPVRRTSDGSKMKKIPAIMNLDKTKSASLPDLKTRSSSGLSDKKLSDRERKVDGSKYPNVFTSLNPIEPLEIDEDDITVVEKTVVILESGKPSNAVAVTSKEKAGVQTPHLYGYDADRSGKKLVAIREHGSPNVGKEIAMFQEKEKPTSEKLGREEVVFTASSKPTTAKPYPTPYARLSSLEDPCTTKSEYTKALPASSQVDEATVKTSVIGLNSRKEKIENRSDASEQALMRESSKGLKALLKFGRKSNTPLIVESRGEPDKPDRDCFTTDDNNPTSAGISREVNTLKHLISQPETSSASATSSKSSRSFSLFSPFRSKTGEKELTR